MSPTSASLHHQIKLKKNKKETLVQGGKIKRKEEGCPGEGGGCDVVVGGGKKPNLFFPVNFVI
jgi:hypothetical protein